MNFIEVLNMYEYVIGNNEDYEYQTVSIFTLEEIPEWEWKKIIADAEKHCKKRTTEIDEFTNETITFWKIDEYEMVDYILKNDTRFIEPIVKSSIEVSSFGTREEEVGIQHYSYNK